MLKYSLFIGLVLSNLIATKSLSQDFAGTVSMGFCSGALVRFDHSVDTDKAIVLTNGHCIKRLQPGQIYLDLQTGRSGFELKGKFGETVGIIKPKRIIYATMTETDLGLYRMVETYGEIKRKYGVSALVLDRLGPIVGRSIRVVSGFLQTTYQCRIEKIIPTLREGDWSFSDAFRYSTPGCIIVSGSSGAPVLDIQSGRVVGMNSTTNENGEACTLNNPCEVNLSGEINYRKDYSYGQQSSWLYDCIDESRTFDLNQPLCRLPH